MKWTRKAMLALAYSMTSAAGLGIASGSCRSDGTGRPATPVITVAKPVGAVKAISGNIMTLTTDAGSTVNILVQDSARLVRISPGQKDLKDATPIQLQEVQVGDRILARGKASDDGKSIEASSIILMKESDVTAKQAHDLQDWQKRGVGGLVSKVDAGNGTITLAAPALGDAKPVTIHISKNTIIRRYSADSVKFDDAKLGSIDQINVGDQLRARGVRSPDGTELAADEVVSGTFRNIAGLVTSTDAGNSTITVTDLVTKKPLTLRISADSQLRKLPPTFAQRIALRLRGGSPDATPGPSTPAGGPQAKTGETMPSANARRLAPGRATRFPTNAEATARRGAGRFAKGRCRDDCSDAGYGRYAADRDHVAERRGAHPLGLTQQQSSGNASFSLEPWRRRGRRCGGRNPIDQRAEKLLQEI